MPVSSRAASVLLALVATALTVTGVVIAATDTNPGGATKDPLVLNGYPPRSAQLAVTISSGQQYDVTANVNVNFATNAVDAQLNVPMGFSNVGVDLRLVKKHVYVGLANLSAVAGAPWLAMKISPPALYGLSLEMTKPDIALISGFTSKSVTTSGYLTTYRFQRNDVAISMPSTLPLSLPRKADVTFSITTGSEGELVSTSFAVWSPHSHASISATVLSYNQPAAISAPPASQVKTLDPALLSRVFGSSAVGSLLRPGAITSLGQIQIN
jgi:hypothetical protein